MDDRLADIIRFCHGDQVELNERAIPLSINDVVQLSMTEMNDLLKKLNLSVSDMLFIKRLRRKIRNRVSSQNARQRTRDRIVKLRDELSAMRACKSDVLRKYDASLRNYANLFRATRELYRFIEEYLQENKDETKMPFKLADIPELPKNSFKTRIKTDVQKENDATPAAEKEIPKHVIFKKSKSERSCQRKRKLTVDAVSAILAKQKAGKHPLIRQLLEAGPNVKSENCDMDDFVVKQMEDDIFSSFTNALDVRKDNGARKIVPPLIPLNLLMKDNKMAAIIKMESEILEMAASGKGGKKRKQAKPRRVVKPDQNCDIKVEIKEESEES